MTSMKKRAQSAKNDQAQQEVYSCTNQEVLAALFIGIGGEANSESLPGMIGSAAIPGVSTGKPGVRELSDDSSAEEDDDLLRQHERIMK